MKNSIKILVLIFLAFLFCSMHIKAQDNDSIIGELINKRNWFALDKEYQFRKNNIDNSYLKLLTEAILNIRFNKSDNAISTIDRFFKKYPNELSSITGASLYKEKVDLLVDKGDYDSAANELKSYLDKFSKSMPKDILENFEIDYTKYNILRNKKKPIIYKPDKDVKIPFGELTINLSPKNEKSLEPKDQTMILGVVKATVEDKEQIFLFDTGAEKTIIFTHFSNDINLHYYGDSINITGIKLAKGKEAILDSISLGEITFYNNDVTITDSPLDNPILKGVATNMIKGIIGLDLIKRMGEIQMYPHSKEIIIPHKESKLPPTGHNIFFENKGIIIKGFNKEKLITFLFDTGRDYSSMSYSYYRKNKDEIDNKYKKIDWMSFGIGGNSLLSVYRIPSFITSIGNVTFVIKNINVNTKSEFAYNTTYDGALGMKFIYKFKKVTLNTNKMFIQLED